MDAPYFQRLGNNSDKQQKKKLLFQRSSLNRLPTQPYEQQLEAMHYKTFLAPFALKCIVAPYKIVTKKMNWLFRQYRLQLTELKYMEDCLVESTNKGKLNLAFSPLLSIPGYNPFMSNNPKEFTDLGGQELKGEEDCWPSWEKRLELSRTSQINATPKMVKKLQRCVF